MAKLTLCFTADQLNNPFFHFESEVTKVSPSIRDIATQPFCTAGNARTF